MNRFGLAKESLVVFHLKTFRFKKPFHFILPYQNTHPNPNPNLNPDPNSVVAVTCLKIQGREMNCREMNSPVFNNLPMTLHAISNNPIQIKCFTVLALLYFLVAYLQITTI